MAITALPESTVHLLGSAQALTTPTSLVKELIDNSLDAKATSIDILISPNTIDKIEVRDNGHGIPQEDLDALGRRGHTSKLRSFDELKSIGGVTLGFRGEALASAVQLGLVSVTTRTEGEAVATSVQLKAPGGIASQSRTSHPVGTKVTVTNFLYKLPVRKQIAEKESTKMLKKIKELLQSYAFARPKVRFCLKISKGGKGAWTFTPRPNEGLKEAAAQIIGRDAAAQCIERSLSFSEKSSLVKPSTENDAEPAHSSDVLDSEADSFTAEFFIPIPKATVMGHGQYISVDSRPVSHDKGTMRKIVSIFKFYAKGSVLEGEEKLKDPFFRLNIKCPVSSYDPNVEPAKDDVIFQNEALVLDSVGQLFKDVYGVPAASATKSTTTENPHIQPDNFELLMSRHKASEEQPNTMGITALATAEDTSRREHVGPSDVLLERVKIGSSPRTIVESIEEPEIAEGPKWRVDMSTDFSEEVQDSQQPSRFSLLAGTSQRPVSDIAAGPGDTLNPWIISKMTAPLRTKNNRASTLPGSTALVTQLQSTTNYLPTPRRSSDTVSDDADLLLLNNNVQTHQNFNRSGIHAPDLGVSHISARNPQGQDNELSRSNNAPPMAAESDDGLLLGDDSEVFRRRNDFNSARNIFEGPMQTSPRQNGPKRSKGVNKPFVPLTRSAEYTIPPDGLRQTTIRDVLYPAPARDGGRSTDLEPAQDDELAWAMDFEHRKEDATRQRRKELLAQRAKAKAREEAEIRAEFSAPIIRNRRQDENGVIRQDIDLTDDVPRSSPHKNRYNAAIADLEAGHQAHHTKEATKPSFKTSLPDGDPRAYLMKRQKSRQPSALGGPMRPIRAKSRLLPLETIPDAEGVRELLLRYPVDMSAVQNAVEKFASHDMYINRGIETTRGLLMNSSQAKLVEARIQGVVEKWSGADPEKTYEVEYKFDKLVKVQ